ncbi:MAG: threonine aldolase, partial [Chloroflexia bacterium]|nr:threonine aldolase [Chloroflexia bacterium]
IEVHTLTRYTDSVQFCLSKGLAAPVGSVLAGTTSFISKARRVRKMLGGGMRQAGVIAAAGLVALTEMVDRLAEDHANARLLAEGLADLPGLTLDRSLVQTAIVRFEVTAMDANSFLKSLRSHGVLMISMGGTTIRAVTHYGIGEEDIHTAINAVRAVLKP